MDSLEQLTGIGRELADAVARLLSVTTPCPKWNEEQAGWRHDSERQDTTLFCLLKLAGSTSTANAMLSLGTTGFWFEAATLARCIREANLSIAFMLPKPDMKNREWPSEAQKQELDSFFQETWFDPKHPFDDTCQRSQIGLKKLAAAVGHFMTKTSDLNRHDAGQVALQTMCFLSDYTHMAYPRLMELLEAQRGYVLCGSQGGSTFGTKQAAAVIWDSCNIAGCILILHVKVLKGVCALASQKGESDTAGRVQGRLDKVLEIQESVERLSATLENDFTLFADSTQKLLRTMKQG